MSFEEFERKTFIVETAHAYTRRRISKREFLKRMGLAGIGFSAFAIGLLGNPHRRRVGSFIGEPAMADMPSDAIKFFKEVGGKFKGTKIRYTSEATPPSVVLSQIKGEFTGLTGIEVEVEIVPLEHVLAKATQDARDQLGTHDLYYLDQSWVATFAPDVVDPYDYYKKKPDLAMPGFGWEDFSKPLVEGISLHEGKWVGVPFDIPIFVLMYRRDLLEKHKIAVPTTYKEFTEAVTRIGATEKANGIFGTGLQAKSGHYALECDWTQAVWGHGGSVFGKDKKFAGNDQQGINGLRWYMDLLTKSPPSSTTATWDGQFRMMASGQVALVQSWSEFFPGLDADGSRVKGLWEPARPLKSDVPLRARADAGFGEIPNSGHQGGSVISLSRHSRNIDAAWIFMQWACCKETMTRCTLAGGFAPTRISSFEDPRVKAKAKVGPGTTRHLDVVRWTIDNAIATEPHMAIWAGLSTNEIPTELGKLLTGQDYGKDPKRCMDALAKMVDSRVKEAGLR
jgi:multiple sugar transport system substrate-binding protein